MVGEIEIIKQLEIIKDSKFQSLFEHLLYQGAFQDICKGKSLIQSHGINTGLNTSKPSPGFSDSDIPSQDLEIEYGTDKDWRTKLKSDVKKLKQSKKLRTSKIKIFVFVSNRNLGDEMIKSGSKKIKATEYCKQELGCKAAHVIGSEEIRKALSDESFFRVRREFLNIEEDLFVNYENFYKILCDKQIISSDDFKSVDALKVNTEVGCIMDKLKFDKQKIYILSSRKTEYRNLLYYLYKTGEKQSKDHLDEFVFIRWPKQDVAISGKHAEELNDDGQKFVVVWGADSIENVQDYLSLANEQTTLVFVCIQGSANKIKNQIPKLRSLHQLEDLDYPFESTGKFVSEKEVDKHKKKIKEISVIETGKISKEINDLLLKFEALIYFYSPFNIDDAKTKAKIIKLLGMSEEKMFFLITIMTENMIVERVGDLLALSKHDVGRKLLNDYIDGGVFIIDQLLD